MWKAVIVRVIVYMALPRVATVKVRVCHISLCSVSVFVHLCTVCVVMYMMRVCHVHDASVSCTDVSVSCTDVSVSCT